MLLLNSQTEQVLNAKEAGVVVAEEDPEETNIQPERNQPAAEPPMRNMDVSKSLVQKYGVTDGCPG